MSSLGLNQSYMKITKEEKMQECYSKAKEYLLEITPPELQGNELQKYFNVKKTFETKNELLYGLLGSLQNSQSGRFYLHNIEIGRNKKAFIDKFQKHLYQEG